MAFLNMKSIFRRLIGGGSSPKNRIDGTPKPAEPSDACPANASAARGIFKKGDFIGRKYEVYGILGWGGFGVVYLVYSHETKRVYALKTFRDKHLGNAETRVLFSKEAQVWVDLERHPYLVRAYAVEEIAARLFIVTEYIAPGGDGLNSLSGYLAYAPPNLARTLRWAIQFCHGMEYAHSRGIRCHRDIKPANILISQDDTVKIADFGLAGVLEASAALPDILVDVEDGVIGLSVQTIKGRGLGTPTHMPPEQFTNAASCDERSDIYSFGIVLYQMASAGRLPFIATLPRDNAREEMIRFWHDMEHLHCQSAVPVLSSPLSTIIERSLAKDPAERYQTFSELRGDLAPLLRRETGEIILAPELNALEAWEWVNKGTSLAALHHTERALDCFEHALAIDPQLVPAWNNKAKALADLGRQKEAIACCDRAIALNPRSEATWFHKGALLGSMGRREEAMPCYDRALAVNPRYALALFNKATALTTLGQHQEALDLYERALLVNPRYAAAWKNMSFSLAALGRTKEALDCDERALMINPRDEAAWNNKGCSLRTLARHEEALHCWEMALAINARYADAWFNKAICQEKLCLFPNAAMSYSKFIELAGPADQPRIARARQLLQQLKS